jgi:hypothetical protein
MAMLPATILQDIEQLPPAAQSQVIDFIEFMKSRYPVEQTNAQSSVEQSFGAIHVKRRVSLEQMDEAIKQGGAA